ncbi:MAG: MFS transporter [Balneolales bacterium]
MNPGNFHTKLSLLLVSSLTVMSGATIAPALPAMQAHFEGVEGLWIRLVLTMPALLIVLAAPVAGVIVDLWGRKYLLIPSIILYGIAGSSGLYLDSLILILAGRALLGVAVAGVMTSATTLIADYYLGTERARFMGWQAAFMSLGGVIFLIGGGMLAELGWRWPFVIYLFSLVILPLIIISLSEPHTTNKFEDAGSKQAEVNGEHYRLLSFICFSALIGMILFYFVPLQIPFYLEMLFDTGPTASGMAIAVSTLFGVFTSLSYGRIRGVIGYIPILGLNFGLMGGGFIIVSLADSYGYVISGLAMCGLGMGLMFPNLNVWLASDMPVAKRGRAIGWLTTAVFLGQFLSPVVSQPLVQAYGLQVMFFSAGIVLILFSATIVIIRKKINTYTAF